MEIISVENMGRVIGNERRYNSSFKISDFLGTLHFYFPLDERRNLNLELTLKKAGPVGSSLVKGIGEIAGIKEIFVEPNGVYVIAYQYYTWFEIEEKLLEELRKTIPNYDPNWLFHYLPKHGFPLFAVFPQYISVQVVLT